MTRSQAHAYLHDGRRVSCDTHGPALALDAESLGCPAAHELALRTGLGVMAFLELWTRAEVAAKLLGRPSLLAFRNGDAHDPGLGIRSARIDDLVVSVGWLRRSEEGPVLAVGDGDETGRDDELAIDGILVTEKDGTLLSRVRVPELFQNGAQRDFPERVEQEDEKGLVGKRKIGRVSFLDLGSDASAR